MEGIDELLDYVKENLDDRFEMFFKAIGKWGGENDENFDIIGEAVNPYVLDVLASKCLEKNISIKGNLNILNPFGAICYAAQPYHFVLGIDGKLRKCTAKDDSSDPINIVGTIENGVIEFNLEKWNKFVIPTGNYKLDEKCENCQFFPLCFGQSCPINRMEGQGNPCPTDFTIALDLIYKRYKSILLKGEQQRV